jgi:hypothetical protein
MAPLCAAESTPRARPLTTKTPRAARSSPRRAAISRATADAALEPTTATAGRVSASRWPRYQSADGASPRDKSEVGNRGSPQVVQWNPCEPARARSRRAASRNGRARAASSGSLAWIRDTSPTRDKRGTKERASKRSDVIWHCTWTRACTRPCPDYRHPSPCRNARRGRLPSFRTQAA